LVADKVASLMVGAPALPPRPSQRHVSAAPAVTVDEADDAALTDREFLRKYGYPRGAVKQPAGKYTLRTHVNLRDDSPDGMTLRYPGTVVSLDEAAATRLMHAGALVPPDEARNEAQTQGERVAAELARVLAELRQVEDEAAEIDRRVDEATRRSAERELARVRTEKESLAGQLDELKAQEKKLVADLSRAGS
jgi:hypothetical protein